MKVMVLKKRTVFPSLNQEGWPLHLFEYLIACLAVRGLSGAVYAELSDTARPVDIMLCSERELMLTKRNKPDVVGGLGLSKLTIFISYLIRDVLESESGAVAVGVIDIDVVGEGKRHFAISARRSASLGSYFQIDQFSSHL